MERETQNLAWCGLPKDTRGAIRMHRKFSQISGHTKDLLETLFGKHNLESDTEPEEMLMVSKKQVQELIDKYTRHFTATSQQGYSHVAWSAQMDTLKALFGEVVSKSEIPTEPKYNVGDKVTAYNGYDPYIATIRNINSDKSGYIYDLGERVNDLVVWISEKDLQPYSEPQPKENKPMEEKELNLAELLKDAIGETIFSISLGLVCLHEIREQKGSSRPIRIEKNGNIYYRSADGKCGRDGFVDLYPSEELLIKYPLDAKKSWHEWSESRKSKRWRAKEEELYYWLGSYWNVECNEESMSEEDNALYNVGNYFRTEAEVEELAEEILKVVNAFHKRKEADQ